MEPFGAAAGAVNCIDAGFRVYKGLVKFIDEAKNADSTAKYLQDKVNSLRDLLLNVKRTLPAVTGTHNVGEAKRLRNQILQSIEECQEMLESFACDLEGLNGQQRLEILRKALLVRKLHKLDPALARFEGNLETHWKAIYILFQCLQTCSNNANSEMLSKLREEVQDGKMYLQQHTQERPNYPPPYRSPTGISNATTAIPGDDESIDSVTENDEKDDGLKSLSDSINVATGVFDRMSRPGSPRKNFEKEVLIDEKPLPTITYPGPRFGDTRPLEILNPLIGNLSGHVDTALNRGNLADAEKHQRSLIECFEQRRDSYGHSFHEYQVQAALANIYLMQGRWQSHDDIHNRLLEMPASSISNQAQLQEFEPPTYPELLDYHSRSYKSLAESSFRQHLESKDPEQLSKAAVMARQSFNLRLFLLKHPHEPDVLLGEAVQQLITILQKQENTVEAEVCRQVYLIHLEIKPLSPPLTPVSSAGTGRQTSSSWRSVDLNAPDVNGFTPLVLALRNKQIGSTGDLLREGADAKKKCRGKTPLIHAIEARFPDGIRKVCEHLSEIDLEERDSQGRTALIIAAEAGDSPTIEALIDLGAQKNAVSDDGRTSLMHAAGKGHASAVGTLIYKGHDCHGTDRDGMNSLHHALHGSGGKEVIELLIDAGIDVDSRCQNSGETALHLAVKQHIDDLMRQENLETLLAKNADLNLEDGAGNTPVSVAVESEAEDAAELLFQQGANYDRPPPYGLHKHMKELLKKYNQGVRPVPRRDSSNSVASPRRIFSRRRSGRGA